MTDRGRTEEASHPESSPGRARVFRFLSSQFIEATAAGCLRFGNLRYFQLLDVVEGPGIGDLNEGVAINRIEHVELGTGCTHHERWQLPRGFGIGDVPPGSTFVGRNIEFIDKVHGFILCFSQGELNERVAAMCAPNGYDGCIEVLDLERLAKRIWSDGYVKGQKVSDFFRDWDWGPVDYASNSKIVSDSPVLEPCAFRKLPFFEQQSEQRIVLYTREPLADDHLSVTFPNSSLADLLEIRDISELTQSLPPEAESTSDDATDTNCLEKLLEVIDAVEDRPAVDRAELTSENESVAQYQSRLADALHEFDVFYKAALLPSLAKAYWTLRQRQPGKYQCDQMDSDLVRQAAWGTQYHHLYFYLQRVDPDACLQRDTRRLQQKLLTADLSSSAIEAKSTAR